MCVRNHFSNGATGQDFAVGQVGEPMAPLGLVHVMRCDEGRDALGGEAVDHIPEFASRLWIDARGRLVKQEQLGIVNQAGRKGQPLFPSAGEFACKLAGAVPKPQAVQTRIDLFSRDPANRRCAQ